MKLITRSLARWLVLMGLMVLSASSFAQSCPAGQFCGVCPAGSYSGQNAATCTPCGAGSFSSPGSASCTPLSTKNYLTGGSITTGTGYSGQAACPVYGYYSPNGQFNSTAQSYGANSVSLFNFSGTNYPIAAYTTCLTDTTYSQMACPPGTTGGCNPPPACNAGYFMVTIANRQYCAAAPRGSYIPSAGGVYMCPQGKTTTSLGNSSASACI